jgi:hypothetical protein
LPQLSQCVAFIVQRHRDSIRQEVDLIACAFRFFLPEMGTVGE